MATYGRYIASGGDTDLGIIGGSSGRNQIAQIMAPMTEHGWITALGSWGGKKPGDPDLTLRNGIWATTGSNIDERLQYSGAVTVSVESSNGGQGQNNQAIINPPIKARQGSKYAIGPAVTGGQYNFSMKRADLNPGLTYDYIFHYKNTGTSIPSNPFAESSQSYEGGLDSYAVYTPNAAPTITSNTMSPADGSNTSNTAPSFSGDFDDANEAQGDELEQFIIEVWNNGATSRLWNTTQTAVSSEIAAKRFTAAYGGSTLTGGNTYRWRYKVSDQFDVWSGWSDWAFFTINAGGTVTTTGSPTGIQQTATPSPYTGTWSHGNGNSTDRVQVRLKIGSTVVKTSPEITKTVANNATISITSAEAAFGNLAWGSSYRYEIRGRDTLGAWSPWSSSGSNSFSLNAYPTVPNQLSPSGGQVTSVRPLLRALTTDADDNTSTGLSISARIKDASGTVLQTRVMTWNVSTGYFEYQTLAADLASFGGYKWDAIATDGTLTTAYSAEQSFTYAQGPTITLISPLNGANISTNTPTIQFSQNSTQVSYSVSIYDAALGLDSVPVWSSGSVAYAAASGVTVPVAVPAGYLHNAKAYLLSISSTNNAALTGTMVATSFGVNFPAPTGPTNVLATPIKVGNDVTASAVLVTFDPPPYASDVFLGTLILRRKQGDDISAATALALLSSTSQDRFVDYYPQSGQPFTYSAIFMILQGTDPVESTPVSADATVRLDHVVINSARDGELRAGLRYGDPMEVKPETDSTEVLPWGQSLPHSYVGQLYARELTGTFELQDDRYSTGANDLAGLRALDRSQDTACYRDQYGEVIFGDLELGGIARGQREAKAIVPVTLRETDHQEGI